MLQKILCDLYCLLIVGSASVAFQFPTNLLKARNANAIRKLTPSERLPLSRITAFLGPFEILKNIFTPMPEKKSSSPTWDDLYKMLDMLQTDNERDLIELRAAGRGPTHSRAKLRLFDAPDGTVPRITFWRDSASWCPYCQLIWLQLEEKRIPYNVEFINMRCYGLKPVSFLAMNPSGGIPVVKIDGNVIKESKVILRAIEDLFPQHNPLTSYSNTDASPLFILERELFSCWFQWLTSGKSKDAVLRQQFLRLLDSVDQALANSGGPYFMGESFSLVDITFTPFLERMSASLPYYKGLVIRGCKDWPALQRWFTAMESRPTYINMRNDYYSHAHNLPPQIGGCVTVLPDEKLQAKYALEIDGKLDYSWRLPLMSERELECWRSPIDEHASKKEAARAIISNHINTVQFACRGAGKRGFPGVGAPLADPNAMPNMIMFEMVDDALRHVVYSLLTSTETAKFNEAVKDESTKQALHLCLEYIRDRIGVPRDMSYPAARQLRAHLNWYMDEV